MSLEPVINLEELLAPIPGENPAGENLLYAGLHDEIREARREDEDLAQGEWVRDLKTAEWPKVESLATEALANRTKDLQVAAWLAEALVKIHGIAGLRDSLRLVRGLLENFWEHLWPEVDDGDLEGRGNSIAFMDRQTAFALKEARITNSSVGKNYSYFDWEEAKRFDIPENLDQLSSDEVQRASELREQAAAAGKVTTEQWRIARNESRRAYYEDIFSALNECWDEYKALDSLMDERFERQTPGLGDLKKSLNEVRTYVEKIVKEKRILEPDPSDVVEEGEEGEGAAAAGAVAGTMGPIRTRSDALRRLAEVSDYFRATEPHSPVSYLVQRAIRWGQMPLDTWLEDVIKDGGVLEHLRETLGLKTSSGMEG